MKRIISYVYPAVAAFLLCGCGDDQPAAIMTLTDIVTFEGYRSGQPVFTLQKNGDSPLVTLTGTTGHLSQTFSDGERLLLRYLPQNGEAYTSGPVAVYGTGRINYDKLRTGAVDGWDADPVYMYALWRTGPYLNMECGVEYSDTPRLFFLILDETTAGDDIPQLYLMHDMGDAPDRFSRRIYASWDIGALWNLESCRGVTVHLRDSNRDIREMTFVK